MGGRGRGTPLICQKEKSPGCLRGGKKKKGEKENKKGRVVIENEVGERRKP